MVHPVYCIFFCISLVVQDNIVCAVTLVCSTALCVTAVASVLRQSHGCNCCCMCDNIPQDLKCSRAETGGPRERFEMTIKVETKVQVLSGSTELNMC